MAFLDIRKNNFVAFLFRKGEIPMHYESITYFGHFWSNSKLNGKNQDIPGLPAQWRLIPDFFEIEIDVAHIGRYVIPQHNWGYAIRLNVDTVDDYLNNHFKSKNRSIIRRYVKRLESCFEIEYKLFFGEISQEQYHFLMNYLHQMILRRFKQRGEHHKALKDWEEIYNDSLSMILQKKASLFVIYDEGNPIEISLNYHFDKILFSSISSYDIDYAKFGLGHVEIHKQLEWCINNDYELFEMGVGGTNYKRRWSNLIYRFENHVTYVKNSSKQRFQAFFLRFLVGFVEYLKSLGVNELLYTVVRRISKLTRTTEVNSNNNHLLKAETTFIDHVPENAVGIPLDFAKYPFLKKPICDYLYTNVERKSHLKLYRADELKNTFYIQGQKMAKITFQ